MTKLRVFFKNFFSHLFPVGEAIYQGVFEKTFKNSVAARESGYCPFTYSMFESHFVPPSKRFLHLTHVWRSFFQPIHRGFLLQFLTATFAAEKRHDFWKNFPTTLYRNFQSWKTTYFPKLFQKMFSPLYRTFLKRKRSCFPKKFPTPIPQVFSGKSKHLFQKKYLYYCYRDIWSPERHTNLKKA